MTLTNIRKVHLIIQTVFGRSCDKITSLGRGASSAAWHVTVGTDAFIVRFMPQGTNRPVTYQSEFAILRLLREQGCAVPTPILNSAECDIQIDGLSEPWAVTRVVNGVAVKKGALSLSAARDLGQVLVVMHALPVEGYGRLAEQAVGLRALHSEALSGLLSRWCWATLWPFDSSSLGGHPITALAPHLIDPLMQREAEIFEIGKSNEAVLCHADLHGEHIFIAKDRLKGIIDFGAAFSGASGWDFASLAFYHGWAVAKEAIIAYTIFRDIRERTLYEARNLSLALSLYKFAKAVSDGSPKQKQQRILEFIQATLRD